MINNFSKFQPLLNLITQTLGPICLCTTVALHAPSSDEGVNELSTCHLVIFFCAHLQNRTHGAY